MSSITVRFDALRSLAAAGISASYANLGTSFRHSMRLVKIVNKTDADLTISFDGVTDNDIVPANGFTLYDITTNKVSSVPSFVFEVGTQPFVKGTPTTGSVYLVAIYGRGE